MKKMLLLLVCLTTFAWLHAEEVTIDFSKQGYSSGQKITDVKVNDYINITFAKGTGTSDPIFHTTGNAIRFYGGNTMTVSCTGATLQEIVFTTPTSGSGSTFNKAFTSTLGTFNSTTKTWTGENVVSTQFSNGSSQNIGQVRIISLKIIYTLSGSENQVPTPSISLASGAVEVGTKVTISCSDTEAEIHYTTNGDNPTAESAIYTTETDITVNEAMTVKAIAVKEGLKNSEIATATYTIKKPVVATPTFDPAPGAVDKGTTVTISCATEGATLMYQVNGGELLEGESGVTVVINEATTIEVVASKDGYVDSEATVKYTIIGEIETAPQAFFDFTKPADLGLTAENDTPISGKAITLNGISVTFSKGTSTDAKVWNNNGFHIRVYQGATITVSAGEGQSIESIQFKGATLFRILYNGTAIAKSGETTANWWSPTLTQRAAASNEVVFTIDGTGRADIKSINVNDPVVTGVEDVTVDENAPVEYYNLQGVRVANPENGIYIRRQGSKVGKVLVK